MRRGQREPFELVEVVETFDPDEVAPDAASLRGASSDGVSSGGAVWGYASYGRSRWFWPPKFVASERVRVLMLVLIAIRFGDLAPGIASVFFHPNGSGPLLWAAVSPLLASVYLVAGALLLIRPAQPYWCVVLLIAATDVGVYGMWWLLRFAAHNPNPHDYVYVECLFVTPSLVILVLGASAWRRRVSAGPSSGALFEIGSSGEVSNDG